MSTIQDAFQWFELTTTLAVFYVSDVYSSESFICSVRYSASFSVPIIVLLLKLKVSVNFVLRSAMKGAITVTVNCKCLILSLS